MMKRLLCALALAALVVFGAIWLGPRPVEAARTYGVTVNNLTDPPPGYSTAVCSLWVNDSDAHGTAKYQDFCAPTGYHFERIDILCPTASGAEVGTIRFWDSATDSVSCVVSGAIAFGVASGYAGHAYSFPIRCHQATFTGLDATDDFQVIGYCKAGAAF